MVFLYTNSQTQVTICIGTSFLFMLYLITIMPYKANILNKFSILNEICVFICSCSLLIFDPVNIESNETAKTTSYQDNCGWIIVVSTSLCLALNCLYLFPVKFYETIILIKQIFSKIKEFLCKTNKRKIQPKIKQIQLTEGKLVNSYGINFKQVNQTDFRKFDSTYDNSANLSNFAINVINQESTQDHNKNPEAKMKLEENNSKNEDNLEIINYPQTQRYHITKIKETVKQKILNADFKEALTVRDARKEGLISKSLYRNTLHPTNLDSIILNSFRSHDEESGPSHNFKPKHNYSKEEFKIDIIEDLKRNNYLLSPRNDSVGNIKLELSDKQGIPFTNRSKNKADIKF